MTLYASRKTWVMPITAFVALFLAHLGTAQLGYYLYQGVAPAVIWLAAGVALGGLVIGGRDLWPAITAASLTNGVLIDQTPILAVMIAAGSTLQAYVAASLLSWFEFSPMLNRLRDTYTFLGVSLGASTLGPIFITAGLVIEKRISPLAALDSFGTWWLAAAVSFIVLGGFIIRWMAQPMTKRTKMQWLETAAAIILACFIAFIVRWTPLSEIFGISLVYVMLAPFFWIAFRIGPRKMTLALLLITLILLTGDRFGWAGSEVLLSERILQSELFSLVWAFIFLLLVSVAEERKEATKAYANHVDQLENIVRRVRADEQVKTEFLAILAHELRNPLAPLLSSIELLKVKGSNKDERDRILTGMEERVQTMGRLLDDLLDISRITRKKLKLQREVIDARDFVERSVASVRVLLESKSHTLHISLPETPLYVNLDPIRFEQIIVNLLTNAIKYTEPGGTIWITLRQRGEKLELSVRDNGIGISKEMLDLVFEPFLQLSHSNQRVNPGLGIGLSLTKRLVELHRGTITVRSEGENRGSEFVVTMPAPRAVQMPIPEPAVPEALEQKKVRMEKPLRILVVDDNESAARGIGELLEYRGHSVSIALDGSGALQAATSFRPDVIILDIGLPDSSGYDIARKLRDSGSDAFLIALTGYGQDEDRLKAEQAGFNYHLTKPIGINDLERVLKTSVTVH